MQCWSGQNQAHGRWRDTQGRCLTTWTHRSGQLPFCSSAPKLLDARRGGLGAPPRQYVCREGPQHALLFHSLDEPPGATSLPAPQLEAAGRVHMANTHGWHWCVFLPCSWRDSRAPRNSCGRHRLHTQAITGACRQGTVVASATFSTILLMRWRRWKLLGIPGHPG